MQSLTFSDKALDMPTFSNLKMETSNQQELFAVDNKKPSGAFQRAISSFFFSDVILEIT